jgi:general secretion pathway protein J
MTTPARRDAGFTLVEALVALAVFSLLAAGMTLTITQAVRAQAVTAAAQDQLRALQTLRALLSADLAQVVPRVGRSLDGPAEPALAGTVTGLSFTRVQAEPGEDGDGPVAALSRVSYGLRDGALVRSTRSALDPGPAATTQERVLLAEAADLRFSYFDGQRWRDTWLVAGSRAVPRAVALTVTTPRYGTVRVEALIGINP